MTPRGAQQKKQNTDDKIEIREVANTSPPQISTEPKVSLQKKRELAKQKNRDKANKYYSEHRELILKRIADKKRKTAVQRTEQKLTELKKTQEEADKKEDDEIPMEAEPTASVGLINTA